MFDFAWSEIMLVGVVALIAIGPKDMPGALKAVAGVVKKARRMAAEFQSHVDEMMREADLHEVREQINELRNFDLRREVERSVDPDGSLRETFASNPLEPTPTVASTAAPSATAAAPEMPKNFTFERPADPLDAAEAEAPSFIPPSAAPSPVPVHAVEEDEPPAFVPPGAHRG